MPFPLPKLPDLALTPVMHQVDVITVFQLLLNNRRFRIMAARSKYPLYCVKFSEKYGGLELDFQMKDWEIDIMVQNTAEEEMEGYVNETWTINKETALATMKKDDVSKKLTIIFQFDNSSLRSNAGWIKFIWDTISPLLRKCKQRVAFGSFDENIESGFFWREIEDYSEIFIYHFNAIPISPSLLKHILENWTAKSMKLNVTLKARSNRVLNCRGSTDGRLKFHTVELKNSDWLRHEHFFDMLCGTYIEAIVPNSDAVNKLIKNWLKGKHQGIHEVHVNRGRPPLKRPHPRSRANPLRPLKKWKVLSGIAHEPTFCKKASSRLRKFNLPIGSVGYDIKRLSDNCIATLWLSNDDLVIQVWPVDFIGRPDWDLY